MIRIVGCAALAIVALGLGAVSGWAPGLASAGAALCLGGAYWMTKCRHANRLGLLPPIANPDGTRIPARWYCDHCGATWPAGIEHGAHPVPRFVGYDQSKAVLAAHRAGELEVSQRQLAIKRSGMQGLPKPRPKTIPLRRSPEAARGRLAG